MWGMQEILLRWRISSCTWPLPPPRKIPTVSGSIWILQIAPSSLGCVTSAHISSDSKSCWSAWGLAQEKALQLVQTAVQALPLGPCDPADPMVLEVSAADRDAVWSFGRH